MLNDLKEGTMKVIKRNGDVVDFDSRKVLQAVKKAMKNGSGIYLPGVAQQIADDTTKYFKDACDTAPIYEIESYVYNRLLHYGQTLTAKSYEAYRAVQTFKREVNSTDDSILG